MEMAMNRIEIEVLSSHAALAAFTRAWRQTRAGRKTIPRLAFGSIAELFSAVSEKRLELVRHVAGEEGLQIRRLARAFRRNRDPGRPAQGRVTAAPGICLDIYPRAA
jgi:predicted transcriptional regulator